MQETDDTIVAISTPPGRGGIGIVRLSGMRAREIAGPLLRLRHPLAAGRARFAEVVEEAEAAEAGKGEIKTGKDEMRGSLHCAADDEAVRRSGRDDALFAENCRDEASLLRMGGNDSAAVLDEAVVTYFAVPNSYTGEDVVEIAAHGSPVLLDALLRRCVAGGARLAEPGEFTQRAFLSGRLDLTQAEAVHDLIQATTLQQARTAARQMGGGLSRQIKPVKAKLIELIAALEAGIDFAEDDLDVMAEADALAKLAEIHAPLAALEASFAYGRVLREGFTLAIVGRPNAGKSSLFNRLIGRERAIVTAQPGTTRDPVAEQMEFAGIPVEMVDTAGLRGVTALGTTLDEAEAIGVAKSRETMAEAGIMLLVVAADEGLHEEDREVIREAAGRNLIVVLNKVDLLMAANGTTEFHGELDAGFEVVRTSATAGTGQDELRAAILSALKTAMPATDSAPVTSLRQHRAIAAALHAVRAAEQGIEAAMPHEMVLLDLHEALQELDRLTGTTHTDEILNLIFSRFCIGK